MYSWVVAALRWGGQERADEAAACLEEATALRSAHNARVVEILVAGLLGAARLRQGHPELALGAARDAFRLIAEGRTASSYALEGLAGVAEVALDCWRRTGGRPRVERREARAFARRACAEFLSFARVFPIGRPRAWLHRGTEMWISGWRRRALRAWRRALAEAGRLAMPYEEGRLDDARFFMGDLAEPRA